MAQYRLNAYDADVFIPEFKGLYQYGDQMGSDLRFSPDCLNVETPGGVLQPAPDFRNVELYITNTSPVQKLSASTVNQVYYTKMTLANEQLGTPVVIQTPEGSETTVYAYPQGAIVDCFLFLCGTHIYEAFGYFIGEYGNFYTSTGQLILGVYVKDRGAFGTYLQSRSFTSYESAVPDHEHAISNTSLFASVSNGLYEYINPYADIDKITTAPSGLKYIAHYAERIWGVGSQGDRSTLFYSKVYNAADWTNTQGAGEEPEDVGGFIREATFDQDEIVALVPFANALIAFSKLRAWKITGTDPSNFYIEEQYGNGTRYPESIAIMGDRIIMLAENGLVQYDGTRVTPFFKEYTHELFRDMTAYKRPIAVSTGDKYMLSLNTTSNKYIIYNSTDNSINIADSPNILDFASCSPCFCGLTKTAAGNLELAILDFDSFDKKNIVSKATKWTTPWIDLGRKDIQKGGFELYFYPELNTDDVTASVTLKFSIQTEKKTKSKSYVVHALTADERTAGKKYKQKRLHFGGAGRRFRLIIETEAGNTVPWRLIGGVHIIAETDVD